MLKLMYITNDPEVAKIAQSAGVDRIFVDMEYIGKAERQGGMDTVQSHHTVEDVKTLRKVLTKSELLVRINPWHEATADYCSSEEEINAVIEAGADIIMLPYFKTAEEVSNFLNAVGKRATTMLLLETADAEANIYAILALGPDEIHIGINDLSLSKGKKFMFEMYEDGTVEAITEKCHKANIPVGIGGIASIGKGDLPAELIIAEQYRLGSSASILSRSFCNTSVVKDLAEIETIFNSGVQAIRDFESKCQHLLEENKAFLEDNKKKMDMQIRQISKR